MWFEIDHKLDEIWLKLQKLRTGRDELPREEVQPPPLTPPPPPAAPKPQTPLPPLPPSQDYAHVIQGDCVVLFNPILMDATH